MSTWKASCIALLGVDPEAPAGRETRRQHILELLTVHPALTGPAIASALRISTARALSVLESMEKAALIRRHPAITPRVGNRGVSPAIWTLRHITTP